MKCVIVTKGMRSKYIRLYDVYHFVSVGVIQISLENQILYTNNFVGIKY